MTAAQSQFADVNDGEDAKSPAPEKQYTIGSPALAPVRQDERITAIDTVRGFALLGILLLNILSFGLPSWAEFNPHAGGGATGWNLAAWFTIAMLFDGKLRAIFSMMFGASVYILIGRLTRKGVGADAADIHYRRMLWMLVFGLMHGYLLWDGDVLYYYAICGLFLYPLRRLSPRVLLSAASVMLLALAGYAVYSSYHFRHVHQQFLQIQAEEQSGKKLTTDEEKIKKEWTDEINDWQPTTEELDRDYQAHHTTWVAAFKLRAEHLRSYHGGLMYTPSSGWWDILAMMLIGIALVKMEVLTGQRSLAFYGWMAAICLGIGLASGFALVWIMLKSQFADEVSWLAFSFYQPSRLAGLGYCAVLMMFVKVGWLRSLTTRLAAVGQMAFTNYILTTVICVSIFEGCGFGLYGKLQRWQLYEVVLGVWLILLAISPVWLKYYRFGPLEWLWRSLTYWKKQPMRRGESGSVLGTSALATKETHG